MPPLVLVVDDEADLLATVSYNLEKEGFDTRRATCGADALSAFASGLRPDLVVLDVMLPDLSGTEVCRRLRADPATATVPVLMLTAKGEEIDRVVGFEVGADDYLVKPFSVRELVLRIRAILRRAEAAAAHEPSVDFGELSVDSERHAVSVGGEPVELTALEFRLLTTLLDRRGRVQSRAQLLDAVWDIQADVVTRTVDTHVRRLRQKLGAAGRYLETIRGVGYRFRESPDQG